MLEVVAFVRIAVSSSTACASARPPRVSHAACLLRNKSDVTGARDNAARARRVIGRLFREIQPGSPVVDFPFCRRWLTRGFTRTGARNCAQPLQQDGAVVTLPRIELNTANSQSEECPDCLEKDLRTRFCLQNLISAGEISLGNFSGNFNGLLHYLQMLWIN